MLDIRALLSSKYGEEIAHHLITYYTEIENNYALQKWKPSELDAGHFVEVVRRILEYELEGKITPLNKNLQKFDDNYLNILRNKKGKESFRILIPYALKAIYNIRNKRGVAHISDISPNEMDSTFILYSCKWVLAEIIRLITNISPSDTQKIINSIIERHVPLIWKDGKIKKVLKNLQARDQILILLYDENPLHEHILAEHIEYKNKSAFKKILTRLHTKKIIHYTKDGLCRLTPLGVSNAERLITAGK